MEGKPKQFDPTMVFKNWIQKNGKAQAEFMKTFGEMIGQQKQDFDPLKTLNEITSKGVRDQSEIIENFGNMQSKAMENIFPLWRMITNFLTCSVFKASIINIGQVIIPKAERETLGIKRGDLVQVIILPLNKR